MARRHLIALARGVGTLALFAVGLQLLDWQQLKTVFAGANAGYLPVAFAAMLAALFMALLRFHAIVAALGGDYTAREGWRLYAGGHGLNQLLPTGLGGDALRLVLLRKRLGGERAVQVIVLDRVVGLFHLFVQFFVLLVLAVLLHPAPDIAGMLKIAGALALGSLFGLMMLRREFVLRLVEKFVPVLLPYALACNASFANAKVHLLSVVAQILFSTSFVLVGLSLEQSGIHGVTYAAMVPAVFALMQVPVSLGGWGMREAAAVALLPLAGMTAETAFANAFLYGVLLLASGLFGLVFWSLAPKVADTESNNEPASNQSRN